MPTVTARSANARQSRPFSKTARFELVDEFADVAVSGTDPIESREGFAHLLDRIEGNGVRIVVLAALDRAHVVTLVVLRTRRRISFGYRGMMRRSSRRRTSLSR